MARDVVPHKLVVAYGEDGKPKSAVLQYRTRDGIARGTDFKTISVLDSVTGLLEETLSAAHLHARVGEGVVTAEEGEVARLAISAAAAKRTGGKVK